MIKLSNILKKIKEDSALLEILENLNPTPQMVEAALIYFKFDLDDLKTLSNYCDSNNNQTLKLKLQKLITLLEGNCESGQLEFDFPEE